MNVPALVIKPLLATLNTHNNLINNGFFSSIGISFEPKRHYHHSRKWRLTASPFVIMLNGEWKGVTSK
jgi:hypothetical protein